MSLSSFRGNKQVACMLVVVNLCCNKNAYLSNISLMRIFNRHQYLLRDTKRSCVYFVPLCMSGKLLAHKQQNLYTTQRDEIISGGAFLFLCTFVFKRYYFFNFLTIFCHFSLIYCSNLETEKQRLVHFSFDNMTLFQSNV